MELLIAIIVSIAIGVAAGWLVGLRYKKSVFGRITRHVTIVVSILLIAFSLFGYFGFSIWTIISIPLVALILTYLVVRNAISRLLEV